MAILREQNAAVLGELLGLTTRVASKALANSHA